MNGHHTCIFGVEITIPITNQAKKIETQFVFHSAAKQQFGEPIYIKIQVDQSKKMVNPKGQPIQVPQQ
jgi:hypothetical protein